MNISFDIGNTNDRDVEQPHHITAICGFTNLNADSESRILIQDVERLIQDVEQMIHESEYIADYHSSSDVRHQKI